MYGANLDDGVVFLPQNRAARTILLLAEQCKLSNSAALRIGAVCACTFFVPSLSGGAGRV
jgi:hypothetical protein